MGKQNQAQRVRLYKGIQILVAIGLGGPNGFLVKIPGYYSSTRLGLHCSTLAAAKAQISAYRDLEQRGALRLRMVPFGEDF